jgi:riboflavin synthase
MFTGLVQATGTLASLEGGRLRVDAELELAEGDSVAVNGVCLTATGVEADGFSADVMDETLRRTTLGALGPGDRVNLELPLRASDRLGGHIVQGHVDGTATVESVRDEGLSRVVRLTAPHELLRYVIEKGSVALDGVSLTITEVDDEGLAVSLIPETLERTTLGSLEPGARLNLEVDVLAKYVERLTAVSPPPSRREGGLVA